MIVEVKFLNLEEMSKLIFPPSDKQATDGFRNLNGDGGRLQLLISLPLIFLIGIGLWLIPDIRMESGISLPGTVVLLIGFFHSYRFYNLTLVEHSPAAMRISRRRQQYIIPYEDVRSVSETRPGGNKVGGMRHSRYVKVHLLKKYPFGKSFGFYTKRDYTAHCGRSGEAKLIEHYALAAGKGDSHPTAAS